MTLGEQKNWVGFKLRSSGSSLWLHLTALALELRPPVSAEGSLCTPSRYRGCSMVRTQNMQAPPL